MRAWYITFEWPAKLQCVMKTILSVLWNQILGVMNTCIIWCVFLELLYVSSTFRCQNKKFSLLGVPNMLSEMTSWLANLGGNVCYWNENFLMWDKFPKFFWSEGGHTFKQERQHLSNFKRDNSSKFLAIEGSIPACSWTECSWQGWVVGIATILICGTLFCEHLK